MSEWISVEDRLPEEQDITEECNEYVCVSIPGYPPLKAMYCGGEWYTNYVSMIFKDVTHWKPRPDPTETV